MTEDDVLALSEAFAPVVARAINAAVRPLQVELAAVKAELAQVKAVDHGAAIAHAVRAAVGEAVQVVKFEAPDVGALVRAAVESAMAQLPPPAAPELPDVGALVDAAVERAVAALPPAEPGRDADPAVTRQLVADAVAALPPAEPGKDAELPDIAAMVDAAVERAVAALPPAEPGRDADPEVTRQLVAEAVAALPPAKDGKDAELPDIGALVDAAVERAIEALPPAEPGRDADPEVTRQLVAEAVAALPPAAPGRDCDMAAVERMIAERVEAAVKALPAAKDGVGLAGALIDKAGNLVVTLTDGSLRELGPVVGKDGDPGKDGKSAFGDPDFEVELAEDGRTLVFRMVQGEVAQVSEVTAPWPVDRGVYQAEAKYQRGDAVSFGGSIFIAQRDTDAKPETGDDWRLSVKRGRDGRDGKMLPAGPASAIPLKG